MSLYDSIRKCAKYHMISHALKTSKRPFSHFHIFNVMWSVLFIAKAFFTAHHVEASSLWGPRVVVWGHIWVEGSWTFNQCRQGRAGQKAVGTDWPFWPLLTLTPGVICAETAPIIHPVGPVSACDRPRRCERRDASWEGAPSPPSDCWRTELGRCVF